jgi:filamentous hemagglutinin family protein
MLFIVGFSTSEIHAQPIVPSSDSTGTIVTPENNGFDISGGALSENGENLFHSFEKFGLNPGQVANFLANPEIQNILSRVIGGDVSVIDGLLKVTGGTPNLYLMNPAGIIFGNGARLDVPASFTATTATGIEFEQGVFSAFEENNYQLLVGDPSSLIFAIVQPGAIVNAGVLTVPDLENLTLAAGQVLNLGTLRGGGVTITTLPGKSILRLTPDGGILSLDLALEDNVLISDFNPSKLPDLLLGTELEQATNLNIQEDGSVWLVASDNRQTTETIVGSQVEILSTGTIRGNGLIAGDRLSLTAQRLGEESNPLLLNANDLTTNTLSVDDHENSNQVLSNLKDLNNLNLNAGNTGLITLTVAGAILDSDAELDVQSGGLTLQTNTGIGTIAAPLQTAVSTLSAQVNAPGDLVLENTGDLTVQMVKQIPGLQTQAGTIDLEVKEGKLTLNSDLDNPPNPPVIQTREGGDITLKANAIILNGNAESSGAQTYQGNLVLGTDVQLNSPQQQNIVFNGTIDSDPNVTPHSLTVQTSGLTEFNGAIGSLAPLANLETDGQGIDGEKTVLNTDQIRTIGSQRFNDPVEVSQSIQFTGSDIKFSRPLEGKPDQNIDLSINADRFLTENNIGESSPFSTINIQTQNSLQLKGNIFSLNRINLISQDGFIQAQNIQSRGGNINLETRNLGNPITQPDLQSGDIQIHTIQTGGSGNLTLNGNRMILNGNVQTDRNQTYQGNLILGTDAQIISTQKGAIVLNGTIDSAPNGIPRRLMVETGGLTQFNGAIGSLAPLASLETDGQNIRNEKTIINSNQITTIGAQNFNDPVQFSQSIQLTGTDIQFSRFLESQPDQPTDFNVNADRFVSQESMGAKNPFSTVTIQTQNNLQINGNLFGLNTINLTSQNGFIQTRNLQTPGGNVNLETLGLVTPINNQPGTQPGDIQVGAIETLGGSVNISAKRFFRATDTINGSSISTAGSENGAITIVHGGQSLNRPFIIGDPNRSNNGVAGNLRTNLAIIPRVQAFAGSVIGGNIQILAGRNNPPINIQFIPPQIGSNLAGSANNTAPPLETIEDINTLEFQNAFGRDPVRQATPEEVQKLLRSINNRHQQTEDSEQFAAVYLYYDRINNETEDSKDTIFNRGRVLRPDDPPLTEDGLSLLIVTEEEIKQIQIPETVNRLRVSQSIQLLRDRLMDPENSRGYKPFAAQLYDWIAKPITEALQDTSVNNLMFVLGRGLRSLPLAALYNRKTDQFLIEEYGLALVPSISFLDDIAVPLQNTQTLAMGASTFANNDNLPLPAVPIELELVRKTRPTQVLQDEHFTFENLQNILKQNQETFSNQPLIMHLATHADFGEVVVPDLENLRSNRANSILNSSNQFSDRQIKDISYLQFFDRKLRLDELENLELDKAGDVELFVISACNTATGNDNAELGFAGLSIQMGAQSALASLWQVSDVGTMILMGEFYNQLNHNHSRTQALRQAQLAMLRGEIGNIEYNQLNLSNRSVALSPDLAEQILVNTSDSKPLDLSHPFYWSAFTLIGSPW